MKTWYKVSKAYVNNEKDAVVTIYSTSDGVRAGYRLPDEQTQMADYPVEEVLQIATSSFGSAFYETVILDEEELWDDNWGELLEHPTRKSKMITKPFR
ncbi:hypothetical protein [Pseudochrobactrum sp. MP213Fo]|uniref:hypothetical protein n=1 Tax=Pseudochrobactrum sp. MP213Fo TaxID=3022250 RepID=UPI003BA20494